jgi:hypothetical protein
MNRAGHRLTSSAMKAACPKIGRPPPDPRSGGPRPVPDDIRQTLESCVRTVGARYHLVTTYHPSSQYWPLQWLEVGIYVGAAALLAGLSLWWIRRRLR